MKQFSSSDLRHLRGKRATVVQLLFVELRDVVDVVKSLYGSTASVKQLVYNARRQLASVGICLPDRRFALPIGHSRADAF